MCSSVLDFITVVHERVMLHESYVESIVKTCNHKYIRYFRADRVKVQLMEQGLNCALYWENDDLAHTVSLVPTSAITGEGVPDLLRMLITLTQERMQVSTAP